MDKSDHIEAIVEILAKQYKDPLSGEQVRDFISWKYKDLINVFSTGDYNAIAEKATRRGQLLGKDLGIL